MNWQLCQKQQDINSRTMKSGERKKEEKQSSLRAWAINGSIYAAYKQQAVYIFWICSVATFSTNVSILCTYNNIKFCTGPYPTLRHAPTWRICSSLASSSRKNRRYWKETSLSQSPPFFLCSSTVSWPPENACFMTCSEKMESSYSLYLITKTDTEGSSKG